jgi:hypothetical protein
MKAFAKKSKVFWLKNILALATTVDILNNEEWG